MAEFHLNIKEKTGKRQMFPLSSSRPDLCPPPPCAVQWGVEPTVFALSSSSPVQPPNAVFLCLWRKMQSLVLTAYVSCGQISKGKLFSFNCLQTRLIFCFQFYYRCLATEKWGKTERLAWPVFALAAPPAGTD